jgi:hypothetical protein
MANLQRDNRGPIRYNCRQHSIRHSILTCPGTQPDLQPAGTEAIKLPAHEPQHSHPPSAYVNIMCSCSSNTLPCILITWCFSASNLTHHLHLGLPRVLFPSFSKSRLCVTFRVTYFLLWGVPAPGPVVKRTFFNSPYVTILLPHILKTEGSIDLPQIAPLTNPNV